MAISQTRQRLVRPPTGFSRTRGTAESPPRTASCPNSQRVANPGCQAPSKPGYLAPREIVRHPRAFYNSK